MKVTSVGTVEERLRRLELAINFAPAILAFTMGGGGDATGTVATEYNPPTGGLPGTVFTLSPAPSVVIVRHGNVWQSKVAAGPGVNQFTYSAGTLTMGNTVQNGDDFYALGFV